MIWLLITIIGLCIGSFFNVLLVRMFREPGSITGRSHCPDCKHTLSWYDLLPLLSFIMLRGTCRYCGTRISFRYPLVESLTAVLFIVFFWQQGFQLSTPQIYMLVLMAGFYFIFLFDLLHYLIPDIAIFPMLVLVAVFLFLDQRTALLPNLVTGLLASLLFVILYVVSHGQWIGLGDVKLVFLIGLAFGYPFGVLILIVAIWAAAIVGVMLLITKRATPKTALPFGSFLSAVAVVYILFIQHVQIYRWLF